MLLKKENNPLTKEQNKSLIKTLYQLYDKGDIDSIIVEAETGFDMFSLMKQIGAIGGSG